MSKAKTVSEVSKGHYFKFLKYNIFIKFYYIIGMLFTKMKAAAAYYEAHLEASKNKLRGPLTKEEIAKEIQYQEEISGTSRNKKRAANLFEDSMLNKPHNELGMQSKATKLVYETLKKYDAEIQSVANIGARVDTASYYLAKKFPEKMFYSIDFQTNLEEMNSHFAEELPNREYISAYATDLMQEEGISYDLMFFTSTICLFGHKELEVFLDSIEGKNKVLVINEPWYPKVSLLNIFSINPPESINVNDPYCASKHNVVHHNYLQKLEDRGYKVELSRIVDSHRGSNFAFQLVAVKL